MAFLTSASPASVASSRTSAGAPKLSFMASQSLAKQKAYEKKAKNYKIPLESLAIFTAQLAALLAAGLPLVASLEALQEQMENPVFRVIIREVRLEISAGSSFSAAVKKFPKGFNSLFISMVEAGEASGNLAEILQKVAAYFEASVKLSKKVKSAMAYPIAVISLAVVLVNVLLVFVIPIFAEMFSSFGSELPLPTQLLIDISNFLKPDFSSVAGFFTKISIVHIGVVLFGLWKIWQKFSATPKGREFKDSLVHRAPIFGPLSHKIALSRFCRTYATLMRSGVQILRTLEIVAASSGRTQIEKACADIAKHISQGGQISDILATNAYFPPMMKHMVRAGESTGNVDGMMSKVADFFDTEVDATVAALTSLIEPLLICFLGVFVGGIVMAMFLPIFNLANVVGNNS
ncbi:MAG TPA: type II secretion system F family protein [Opitutaceae bacterium]|nr:type II secretion system F family protein [Opitutaceae bacterium]